jgi:ribosomal protein L35AE/L33A
MERRGEVFWQKMVELHSASGLSAVAFCKERSLKRGTFLRWRKRFRVEDRNKVFIELRKVGSSLGTKGQSAGIEIRVGNDIQITVRSGSDLELFGNILAAIRRAS